MLLLYYGIVLVKLHCLLSIHYLIITGNNFQLFIFLLSTNKTMNSTKKNYF